MPSGLHSSGSSAWPILLRPHNILVGATHPDTLEPDVDWLERTLEECTPVPHVGGELTDFIIVLHDLKAAKAFCNHTCIFLLKQAAVLLQARLVEQLKQMFELEIKDLARATHIVVAQLSWISKHNVILKFQTIVRIMLLSRSRLLHLRSTLFANRKGTSPKKHFVCKSGIPPAPRGATY